MLRYLVIMLLTLTSCVLCELLHKYEGDSCQWGEVTGTCVHIYKCPRAPMYLKQKNPPPICSFKGKEPIICCTDCELVEDNRKVILNKDLGVLHLTGQKAHDQCVKFIDELDYTCKENSTNDIDVRTLDPVNKCRHVSPKTSRYFGPSQQFKYYAIMGYGSDLLNAQWACAGTIISEKFILTAGYCLDNPVGPIDFVAVNVTTDVIALWQKYAVKRSIPHPEYRPGSKYHDIALVETQDKITFSNNVLPACLQTDPSLNGHFSSVAIWETENGIEFFLKTESVFSFDTIKCSYFYPPHDEYLKDGFNETIQVCFGDMVPPTDSCVSDVGSPVLVYYDFLEECADVILGVMSIERNCGTLEASGLFTKVIHYVPWIESIVWP